MDTLRITIQLKEDQHIFHSIIFWWKTLDLTDKLSLWAWIAFNHTRNDTYYSCQNWNNNKIKQNNVNWLPENKFWGTLRSLSEPVFGTFIVTLSKLIIEIDGEQVFISAAYEYWHPNSSQNKLGVYAEDYSVKKELEATVKNVLITSYE